MPQVRKDAVRDRITAAALAVFARDGGRRATVAAIARAAGVSTGNVYRYFPTKEALLDAVLGDDFVAALTALVRRRVAALQGVVDVAALPPDAEFHAVAEALLRFAVANRLRVVLLLGRAAGTRYEPCAGGLLATLKDLAVAHFRALDPALVLTPTLTFTLDRIYQSWLETLVAILERYDTEPAIRAAVADFSRYHLTGLRAFFRGA